MEINQFLNVSNLQAGYLFPTHWGDSDTHSHIVLRYIFCTQNGLHFADGGNPDSPEKKPCRKGEKSNQTNSIHM